MVCNEGRHRDDATFGGEHLSAPEGASSVQSAMENQVDSDQQCGDGHTSVPSAFSTDSGTEEQSCTSRGSTGHTVEDSTSNETMNRSSDSASEASICSITSTTEAEYDPLAPSTQWDGKSVPHGGHSGAAAKAQRTHGSKSHRVIDVSKSTQTTLEEWVTPSKRRSQEAREENADTEAKKGAVKRGKTVIVAAADSTRTIHGKH